jgi:hypothetical protein
MIDMNVRRPIIVTIIAVFVLLASSCVTPTISETHLLSDIQEKELSLTVGTEFPEQIVGENHIILPDILFEYLSFAPTDWFEFGLAGHYTVALLGIDARLDFVDMFTNDSPLSAMLLGGVQFFSGGSPIVHLGVAVNYRLHRIVELYVCGATSTITFVPVFHLGANLNIFEWLSLSANLKTVYVGEDANTDSFPAAFMLSVAPRLSFEL